MGYGREVGNLAALEIDPQGVVVMLTCLVCGAKQERPTDHCSACGFDPNEEG